MSQWIAALLAASIWIPAAAATPQGVSPQFSTAQDPCTPSESWTYGQKIPESWRKRLASPLNDSGAAIGLMLAAEAMRQSAASSETRLLAEYWVWRTAFDVKAYHLAHQGFSRMAVTPAEKGSDPAAGIRSAALKCASRIQKLLPQLKGPASLKHAEFSLALSAAASGDEAHVVGLVKNLLKPGALPEELEHQRDALHLMLGRAYYGLGKHDLAAREFRSVTPISNLLPQALIGLAWSHLMSRQYPEAVSAAYNLFYGPLARTFAPEANLIVAIALTETCHYPEAVESLRYFRKSYARAYQWLNEWNSRLSTNPVNLYTEVATYLGRRSRVPDRVGTEWLRSPIFLSSQAEVNSIVDEREAIKAILTRFEKTQRSKRPDPRLVTAAETLRRTIIQLADSLKVREADLLTGIQADLHKRNLEMRAQLADLSEQDQLVEAEIYNALGEHIILEFAFQGKGPSQSEHSKKSKEDGPVWDWGRYPAEEGHAETWEDELGFLKSDFGDRCNPR